MMFALDERVQANANPSQRVVREGLFFDLTKTVAHICTFCQRHMIKVCEAP